MKKIKREKTLFHRLFILAIILVLPIFIFKEYRIIKAKKDTRIQPTQDFYAVELEPQEDKHFTFLVLTHNDAATIEQNFKSIVTQSYAPFRVVYLDQGSTDQTTTKIQSLIAKEHKAKQVTLIQRKSDSEVFESYYRTVESCQDGEVVIHLHGSDWLAHDEVLSCLNQTYSNPDVWLTYGQYLEYENYKKGIYNPRPQKNIYKKRVQKAPWVGAYLKTFYAGLFKKARCHEASCEGFFLTIENESSLLRPLAEMGKAHVQFIPDVLYIHNKQFGKKRNGMKLAFTIDSLKESMKAATKSQKNQVLQDQAFADMMIFSEDSPGRLRTSLASIEGRIRGLNQVTVIYTCSEASFTEYEKVKAEFPSIHFIRPSVHSDANFKASVLKTLIGGDHSPSYILLSTDEVILNDSVSLLSCVEAMRKTRAYGFYFHLDRENYFQETEVEGGIYSWVIGRGNEKRKLPNTLEMGLYRKIDLERDFKEMHFFDQHDLIQAWAELEEAYRIGLSFDKPKTLVTHSLDVAQREQS